MSEPGWFRLRKPDGGEYIMARGNLRVTVLLANPENADSVIKRLRAKGFKPESSLKEIGVVVGTVPEAKLASLSEVDGVTSVEREREIQLPPPESGIL